MRRYANRTDDNHAKDIGEIEDAGFSVADTSAFGGGFPDIVVGGFCLNFLFEIKNPNRPPSARILTPAQIRFRDSWKGQYNIIECADEALEIITRRGR